MTIANAMTPQALRRLYPAELAKRGAAVGGKTRKRTFRRMVEAVSTHRGGALDAPDNEVLVWSDLPPRTREHHRVPGATLPRRRGPGHGNLARVGAHRRGAPCSSSSATWRWAMRCATPPGNGCDARRVERGTSSSEITT